jgi:hypothetical protein
LKQQILGSQPLFHGGTRNLNGILAAVFLGQSTNRDTKIGDMYVINTKLGAYD